ncbi:MAG: DNA polymerase III subunit gamma/tau [Paludibacteraceae bacterium]|nr:DNA polymerase III subunit gamma/tau [Paludibacteraceae bacterium]
MDNFIVSARKYRPTTFNSVVGQKALTTTLKNAITSNHLAHAYLFCGPRGVGKTTCARIFAKTINCQNLTAEHEACNECESCVAFNEGRSYNIHELDAASNNGVDDIRTLIDQVRIPPQIGKYSVYIVDEVHMLSQGAFNAFLKTLEEPPAHAMFILATTEKHKIIPTILSRCQIYDFNRITVADTVAHLQYVAQSEGVTVDVNALSVIAQKSDGGMRDALSIFDQLVSFCGNNISYQGAIDNLNVLDYEYYFRLVEAFLVGNVTQSLLIFNEVLSKGFDGHHFITGLSAHLRDVLVSKDPATLELLEVGAGIGQRYQVQAQHCSPDFLYRALKIANDCDLDYRISKNKRLLVELALIRLCQLTDEKKNSELTDAPAAPIQKIVSEPVPQMLKTATQAQNNTAAAPVRTNAPQPYPTAATTPQPASAQPAARPAVTVPGRPRPVSISINKTQHSPTNTSAQAGAAQTVSEPAVVLNESFNEDQFLNAWRSFTATINDDIKRVGFQNTTLPRLVTGTEFEVLVNNVMQENELKKIQTDIVQYLIVQLRNSGIRMRIRMIEESEKQRSITPEERFKMMVEENPLLEKLRKNLGFEID